MKHHRLASALLPLAAIVIGCALLTPLHAAPLPQPAFPLSGTVNRAANLRSGPGTSNPIAGSATAGAEVQVVDCNTACDWYELATGEWIAAFLVDLEEAPTVTDQQQQPAPPGEQALVERVIDGDTISVILNGETYRLRYIGMDTPEAGDTFGSDATAKNREMVDGQTVYLEKDVSETDRFSRLLRHVWLANGTLVGEELVRLGYAYASSYPPDVKYQDRMRQAQQEATAAGRGLWADAATPTPAPQPAATPPTANRNANLRAGPGTTYAVAGSTASGQQLDIVARNSAGDWLQLASGAWIAAFLVNNVPGDLAVADASSGSTRSGTVEKAPPTATPAPVRAAPPSNCDPSYPTVCIPPAPPDLDCGDIPHRRFEVLPPDPHRFDGNHDGVGCEG